MSEASIEPPTIAVVAGYDILGGQTILGTEVYDYWNSVAPYGYTAATGIFKAPVSGYYNINAWLYGSVEDAATTSFGDGFITIGITSAAGGDLYGSSTMVTTTNTKYVHITATVISKAIPKDTELVFKVLNRSGQSINIAGANTGYIAEWSAQLVKIGL